MSSLKFFLWLCIVGVLNLSCHSEELDRNLYQSCIQQKITNQISANKIASYRDLKMSYPVFEQNCIQEQNLDFLELNKSTKDWAWLNKIENDFKKEFQEREKEKR